MKVITSSTWLRPTRVPLSSPDSFIDQFYGIHSGDTGVIADQDLVVRRFYKPQLAVMNIGGTFSTGPQEAAYVINDLVKPNSVIASHANEASTKDGKLLPGSKTLEFKKSVKVPTYVPLSGKTMEFNAVGNCVAGC